MLKVAVISDIHAELQPLQEVLEDISNHDISQIWCLGDFASGGPDALLCFEAVLSSCSLILGGNHELFVAAEIWEDVQADYALWAKEAHSQLGQARVALLKTLSSRIDSEHIQMVHGSMRDPLMEWVSSEEVASAQWELMAAPLLLFGHTHRPAWWHKTQSAGAESKSCSNEWGILEGINMLNPGAVCNPGHWSWMELELDDDGRASRVRWHNQSRSPKFRRRVEY